MDKETQTEETPEGGRSGGGDRVNKGRGDNDNTK